MSKALTYEYIKEYINGEEGNGCILLSSEEDFEEEKIKQNKIGSHVKLKIQCKCGDEFQADWNKFKSKPKRQCNKCGYIIGGNKERIDGNKVYQDFINNDFTPLFKPEDYKMAHLPLPYICNKHKDRGTQYMPYSCVKRGHGCHYCSIDKRKGENHYSWKGGVSPINEYLRRHLITWKKDTMKFNDFKCVLTKQRFDIIHHLYSFESIAKEVFKTIIIPVNPISEYTKEQLEILDRRCIELHYKYGFGICLVKPLHNLFHKQYSEMNNTPEQFLTFIQRLNSHEFDTYLQENNLTLDINYNILNKLLNQFNLLYETETINKIS